MSARRSWIGTASMCFRTLFVPAGCVTIEASAVRRASVDAASRSHCALSCWACWNWWLTVSCSSGWSAVSGIRLSMK